MTELTQTREAYGQALLELGSKREDIVVLDADLYKSTRTVLFRDAFPERFLDIGIAEADMVSTAAGMASTGLIAYANSFAMFITGVCWMPIRIQIAYPSLPVKLIGSSAGLTQGPDGASHQSLEDVALMRCLPNMIVVSPADDVETAQATWAIADWPGPVYMRLGRYPVPGTAVFANSIDAFHNDGLMAGALLYGGELTLLYQVRQYWRLALRVPTAGGTLCVIYVSKKYKRVFGVNIYLA